jgi:hypothetical protein
MPSLFGIQLADLIAEARLEDQATLVNHAAVLIEKALQSLAPAAGATCDAGLDAREISRSRPPPTTGERSLLACLSLPQSIVSSAPQEN